MTSSTDTQLVGGGNADVSTVNPWGSVDDNVNNIADCPDVAEWIWDAAVATGYYADEGGMVDFVQNFDIIGTPTSATLKIAADNAFAYSLNSGAETAENLGEDWRAQAALGNFDWPTVVIDPNPSGWSQVYTYDVLGSLISSSTNTMNVTGVNADWNTASWSVNPAAVIYKLCGTSEEYVVDRPYDEETAWGGEEDFPGRNWATYISYIPIVDCDYGSYVLEFWAGNSYLGSGQYPAQPAILEVQINGTFVGTLALAYTPPTAPTPGWMQFSYTWDAGSATSANIEIRDTRHIMYGDDFVLDDISFVKQP